LFGFTVTYVDTSLGTADAKGAMPDEAQQPTRRGNHKKGNESSVVAFPSTHQRPPLHNLPLELSSFVGREQEIAEVRRLLVEEEAKNRLLTLTGPGGGGKTRLALAVAFEVVEHFDEGGVWWVGLASLSDPDLVPQAVAAALGVREAPGRSLTEMLAEHLRPRKNTLLVLDNCEHLIDACATLADTLLRVCPNLQILATSREALGVAGERAWLVPSLSLPDPERLPPLEELGHYEAVRLFLERAVAVAGRFELTEENKSAVVRLCERLEGMPLAIELAAARAKVLSAQQIASRLEDSFGLLASESRTALARQQTLRATIDWSYELLSEGEKGLFRRLSVFAGGWTLEAAEEVCAREIDKAEEVLGLLTHLVDKSLVLVAEQQQDGEACYRFLETVRQYGWERLQASGETARVRRRHAEHYVALAEEAEPHLKEFQQVVRLKRLEREHDNLRAAMRWLLEDGEVETAVRLAWALRVFWRVHGYQGEGYRYAGEALEKGDTLPAIARARALCVGGLMSYGLESVERTRRLWEESATLFRQTEDRFGQANSMVGVGIMTLQQGDMESARALFEEALELYREIGDKWGVSSVLSHLGIIPLSQGDHVLAVRYFEEALEISREIGDRLFGSIALYNLALEESRVQGDHERAAELYVEGLGLAVEIGDKAYVAYCLEGLASLISERGEPERAARLFGASEELLEAVGAPLHVQAQDRALYERAVEALRSRLGEEAFGAAWAEGRAMTLEQAAEYTLELPPPSEESTAPTAHPAGLLSAREVEVLGLVAQGLTDPQVAERLYLSPRTVGWHLRSIYRKLGVPSRAAAARAAVERSLI
jgi:predicted ATPase/DNA-binding CsgD family transcriptional regulator